MKIRRAKLSDVNQLYNLMNLTKEIRTTSNKIYSKNLIKEDIKDNNTYFAVVEDNKKIIALSRAALWKKTGFSYWDTLIVNKAFRNKGIGKKLYSNYIKTLKKLKITYFWGIVKKDNYIIQKVLKNFGMRKRDLCYYYDQELK